MSGELLGRVSLVTGASRGIGRAIAVALGAAGSKVAIHYSERADLAEQTEEEVKRAGGNAVSLKADLTDPSAAARLVRCATEALGDVDILVNNAGHMSDSPVEEMTDEAWEKCISLNLSAAFRLARACIPSMKAGRWGRIISISSQAAFTGSAEHAHYSAAKAGILGLTFSLAKELAVHGITVNAVAPGRIATDMIAPKLADRCDEWLQQIPMRRFGRPEEVAGVVMFLASTAASYLTGSVVHVNGGMYMG